MIDQHEPKMRAQIDGRWEGPDGHILVEVKKTNSARDVRDALLELAYHLKDEPSPNIAVCVIVDTRLSYKRLNAELERFREVIHPGIANRVHFLLFIDEVQQISSTEIKGSMEVPGAFSIWLDRLVANEQQKGATAQVPSRQIVVSALAQLRLWNASPVTVKYLQEICRTSYPTVATVLKELTDKGWLEETEERGVRLRRLSSGEWMELAREHAGRRKVHLFTDPTGHTSPSQMMRRLTQLRNTNTLPQSVRIGGVVGATQYFPELDITAPARLDLCVASDPKSVARMLDAGLLRKTMAGQSIALAVHETPALWESTEWASKVEEPWADVLDCLADLVEMGYVREANEWAQDIERRSKRNMFA